MKLNTKLILTSLLALGAIATSNIVLSARAKADNLISDLDDSGLVSPTDIQQSLQTAAGDTQPLDWTKLNLKSQFGKSDYQLTTILTGIADGMGDDILFTDTLPTINQPESTITEYTTPISLAAQSSFSSSIVVPRMFNGEIGFTTNTQIPDSVVVYNFYLKPDALEPLFDIVNPEGTYQLTPFNSSATQALNWTNIQALQTRASKDNTLPTNTSTAVAVTPRQPDTHTLTFDITSQPIGSNASTETVLVYQKM